MSGHDSLEWMKKADADLDMAGRALQGKKKHPDSGCYHAQQAAEKYFKALLVAQGIEFPKTHDLLILNQLCVSHGILTAFDEDSLDFLSAFAIRVRYPGVEPDIEEARKAIAIAKTVRKFARQWLGLK
jgi:HEPN domain-containing protein